MPIYEVNGNRYDIPEEEAGGFEKSYPNANIVLYGGDDMYSLPLSERDGFMKSFGDKARYATLDEYHAKLNKSGTAGSQVESRPERVDVSDVEETDVTGAGASSVFEAEVNKEAEHSPVFVDIKNPERRYVGEKIKTPEQQEEEYKNRIFSNMEYIRQRNLEGGESQSKDVDLETFVESVVAKHDVSNAAAKAWQRAEERTKADQEKHNKKIWDTYASLGGGRELRMMQTGETYVSNAADRMTNFDLQRMADDAWELLGEEGRQAIITDLTEVIRERYPEADESTVRNAATNMARQQSDMRMFKLAVENNAPKNAVDYFFRKALGQNAMVMIAQALARSSAGSTGDMEAREYAEQQYEKEGHGRKAVGIAGTVAGFVIDPTVWMSMGVSNAAVKGATWAITKKVGEKATREFMESLGGRLALGAVAGGANFATYESSKEILDQLKWGGARDQETGEVGDYSFGRVAGRFGHGALLGTATGTVAPLLGNVFDPLVKNTDNVFAKAGLRTGELASATVAEGTVFSVPEWLFGEGDAFDVWTDNLAMMAGFKLGHMVKSAPARIKELSMKKDPITQREIKAGFETRLKAMLDGKTDMALTKDEREELRRGGYGDFDELVEEYENLNTGNDNIYVSEQGQRLIGKDIPYNKFAALIEDGNISESARAKIYYYITGERIPVSTVIGVAPIIETKDVNGNVDGYIVQSFGANGIITSRSFKGRRGADAEYKRIMRQAELNTIDIGEKFTDRRGDVMRMYEACRVFAESNGVPTEGVFNMMRGDYERMTPLQREWADKVRDIYESIGDDKYSSSGIRAGINSKFGVDIDKVVAKEPNRRSGKESAALKEYMDLIIPKNEENRQETHTADDNPSPLDIAGYIGSKSLVSEEPKSESYRRGYEADDRECRDILIEFGISEPDTEGYAEAKDAFDGAVRRINEDADMNAALQMEEARKMVNTDGMFHPAVMKDGRRVYIVGGSVKDSSGEVDPSGSDATVVVYDAADGRNIMVSAKDIDGVGYPYSMEEAYGRIIEERKSYVRRMMDDMQGTVVLNEGADVVLPDGMHGVVSAVVGDGVTVTLDDGSQIVTTRQELQRVADDIALNDYRMRHGGSVYMPEQEQLQGEVEVEPQVSVADMKEGDVLPISWGGEDVFGIVTGIDQESGNKIVRVEDAEGNVLQPATGELTDENWEALRRAEPAQPEAVTQQEEPAEQAGEPAQETYPKDAKGEPVWLQMTDGQVDLALSGLDDAKGFVEDNLNEANAKLKKAEEAKPKKTTLAERKKEEADIKTAQAAAKTVADFWKRQSDRLNQSQQEGAEPAQEQKAIAGLTAETPEQGQIGRSLTEDEADDLMLATMESAEPFRELELTRDNWLVEFGEEGSVTTPLGEVKMGEHQYEKLEENGRETEFGLIKPTLTNPDFVIEQAKDGQETERPSSYLFIKSFIDKDGNKKYFFKSVTVQQEGMEVSVSNYIDRPARVRQALQNGKLLWMRAESASNSSDVNQGLVQAAGKMSEPAVQGRVNPQSVFDSKDTQNSDTATQNSENISQARQIYNKIIDMYGGKASHKIDVTVEDRTKELAKAKKALDKAQKNYDDAPIGKEEKTENILQQAQKDYEKTLQEKQMWDEVKAIHDIKIVENTQRLDEAEAEIQKLDKALSVIEDEETDLWDLEPVNAEEAAAERLVGFVKKNNRINDASLIKETGWGVEDVRAFRPTTSPDGGMTLDAMAESLYDEYEGEGAEHGWFGSVLDAKNVIIGVLQDAGSYRGLVNYIKSRRGTIDNSYLRGEIDSAAQELGYRDAEDMHDIRMADARRRLEELKGKDGSLSPEALLEFKDYVAKLGSYTKETTDAPDKQTEDAVNSTQWTFDRIAQDREKVDTNPTESQSEYDGFEPLSDEEIPFSVANESKNDVSLWAIRDEFQKRLDEAQSEEERAAVLQEYADTVSPAEHNEVITISTVEDFINRHPELSMESKETIRTMVGESADGFKIGGGIVFVADRIPTIERMDGVMYHESAHLSNERNGAIQTIAEGRSRQEMLNILAAIRGNRMYDNALKRGVIRLSDSGIADEIVAHIIEHCAERGTTIGQELAKAGVENDNITNEINDLYGKLREQSANHVAGRGWSQNVGERVRRSGSHDGQNSQRESGGDLGRETAQSIDRSNEETEGGERYSIRGRDRWDNSGYTERDDGSKLSVNALEAEKRGKFTEGAFRKVYGVAKADWETLKLLGAVKTKEWHHTGKAFKASDFYEWSDNGEIRDGEYIKYPNGNAYDGSLGSNYAIHKKEINNLVKEWNEKPLLFRVRRNVPDLNSFVREKVFAYSKEHYPYNYDLSDYAWLTAEEEEQRKNRQRTISELGENFGDRYKRREAHTNIDLEYAELSGRRKSSYQDQHFGEWEKEYNDKYGKDVEVNNRLEESNMASEGAENALYKIAGLLGMDMPYDRLYSISKNRQRQIYEKEREEQRRIFDGQKESEREALSNEYDKKIASKQKSIDRIKDNKTTKTVRALAKPDVVEYEEMNGKYGWFRADDRYNLPRYYTGFNFNSADDKKLYDKHNAELDRLRSEKRSALQEFDRKTDKEFVEQYGEDIRFSVENSSSGYVSAFYESNPRYDGGLMREEAEEESVRFSIVKDPEKIEALERGDKDTGYRNVVLNDDGTMGSPMADKLGKKGNKSKATIPFHFGIWEQSDENPGLATDNGKIDLIKPDGLGTVGSVDYNPYIHIRPTTLNKQFKNAWERDNLVYIETLYPASELTSGYRAEKAKKPVGRHKWNGGDLILSRYDKPIRIVPWEEVADGWVQDKEISKKGAYFDIVPPRLLPILVERGIKILPPHKGMGEDCVAAYNEWKGKQEGENDAVRFSLSEGADPRSLVGLHNLSVDQLEKALRNGGLANPSAAVIDMLKQTHDRYGDVTLVMPHRLVEARSGKHKGVWGADIYSPNYPQVYTRLTSDNQRKLSNWIYEHSGEHKNELSMLSSGFMDNVERGELGGLEYIFLKEKGVDLSNIDKFHHENFDNFWRKYIDKYDSSAAFHQAWRSDAELRKNVTEHILQDWTHNLTKSEKSRLVGEWKAQNPDATVADFKNINTRLTHEAYKSAKEAAKSLIMDDNGETNYDIAESAFVDNAKSFRNKGSFDVNGTLWNVSKYMQAHQLYDEYREWARKLVDGYEPKEQLYNGMDREGRQRFVANTLENASRIMKKRGLQGGDSFFAASMGGARAQLTPVMKTLKQIRDNKWRLNSEAFEKAKKELENEYYELGRLFDRSSYDFDSKYYNLINAMKSGNAYEWAKRNGFDISEEDGRRVDDYARALRDMPTEYFELKFERPVGLDEFVAAVVPDNTPIPVRDELEQQGLVVHTYQPDVEGSRQQATQKAAEETGAMFSLAEPFYSNAERAVEQVKQDKASGDQWLAMIQKQGGLKAEEDKWMGLSDFLRGKKSLTKQEVFDFIRENQVQVEEVDYAENPKGFDELKKEYDGWLRNEGYDLAQEHLRERYGDDADIAFDDIWGELVIDNNQAAASLLGGENQINSTRLEYTTEGLENKREIALTIPTIKPYKESDEVHFGDAGQGRAVAWVRFGDATDGDGNKVLVIDEIQSERHQDGREKGYKDNAISDKVDRMNELELKIYSKGLTREEYAEFQELQMEGIGRESFNLPTVPDAPFRKNWQELAMKRMLRYAAENGYDKVAWTTGEQQAERYDISKVIDVINSTSIEGGRTIDIVFLDGGKDLMLNTDNNGIVTDGYGNQEYEGKHLSEIIGKEVAEKLLTGDKFVQVSGDNLSIGGEGMKGFYDQILPRFMDKYGKKWGVKTQDVTLDLPNEADRVMHSVDVTPEMKKSVMEGQPMFSLKDHPDDGYDAGPMTTKDIFLKTLVDLSEKNKENNQHRLDAIKALNDSFGRLRKAMSIQKEYDKSTVDQIVRLARTITRSGFFSGFSVNEVNRLMSAAKNANSRSDITKQASQVVDLLLEHSLKELDAMLNRQVSVRGTKVDDKGVVVQGRLDVEGQRVMAALKEGMKLDVDELNEALGEAQDRMGSDNRIVADNAALEYQGLMLAKQYLETIKKSKEENEKLLGDIRKEQEEVYDFERVPLTDKEGKQILNKDGSPKTREVKRIKPEMKDNKDAVNLLREKERAIEVLIRENKVDRVDAYVWMISSLGGQIRDFMGKAKAFRDREIQHIQEIQHNANSDMEGIPSKEYRDDRHKREQMKSLVNFFASPMQTFIQMMRFFGSKSVDGQGYLYNRFIPAYTKASDTEWKRWSEAKKILDAKSGELFGKGTTLTEILDKTSKMPYVTVMFYDGGEKTAHDLPTGNALYIYMVNKMTDGAMKLRAMGIDQEDVERIKAKLDSKLIEFADWVQGEFLPSRRNYYNEVHERMFGAPMAAVEDYFPLKINSDSRSKKEDVGKYEGDDTVGSTVTGAIIKRVRNITPLNLLNANAFEVLVRNVQEMEHWAAFAELSRDLGTLLSYKHFRNQVKNMKSVRFGDGERLWDNFKTTCAIMTGTYNPKTKAWDEALCRLGKNIATAKISFRLNTAIKQLLSAPAYIGQTGITQIGYAFTHPVETWRWAIDELPGFAKRWQSKAAGDTRLRNLVSSSGNLSSWQDMVNTIASWGMTPNAAVDAVTVMIGARSIFLTRYKRYIDDGYGKKKAREKALIDASVAYNDTQQSAEGVFVSAIQVDRTFISTAFTLYRNASMSYTRKFFESVGNIGRMMQKGYKTMSTEFAAKQMEREGLKPEKAKRAAERAYRRAWWKNIATIAVTGYILPFFWNLGSHMWYLVFGDDEDTKKAMIKDSAEHAVLGPIEGLTSGGGMSTVIHNVVQGNKFKFSSWNMLNSPMMQDIDKVWKDFSTDWRQGVNELIGLVIQGGVGVNPEIVSDIVVSIMDATNGDLGLGKEIALLLMRISQVPQSQLDNIYIDELGMSARDAKTLDYETLASRYVEYNINKNVQFLQWTYSEDDRKKTETRYAKRFENLIQSRVSNMDDERLKELMEYNDVEKRTIGKEAARRAVVDYPYQNAASTEYGRIYERLADMNDMLEDAALSQAQKDAENDGDENLAAIIKADRDELNNWKKDFTDFDGKAKHNDIDNREYKELMDEIRARRKEMLEKIREYSY